MTRLARAARAAAFSVGMAAAGASIPAAAATCAKPVEHAAMQVRILQSDLMVAALTCGDRDRYNSFVRRFRPALADHGKALQDYFQRTHGKGGKSALNTYVTTLANEASTRRLAMGTAYCSLAGQLFDEVLRLKSTELGGFSVARGVPSESSAPACSIKSAGRERVSSAN